LHHAAVFMPQDVAVQHELAWDIHKAMADDHPPGLLNRAIRNLKGIGNNDGILPLPHRVIAGCNWIMLKSSITCQMASAGTWIVVLQETRVMRPLVS